MAYAFVDEEPTSRYQFVDEPDEPEGAWEGLVKPTLKAIPRVVGHTVASMAQMPISGVAAGARYIMTGGDLNAANKVLEDNQKALDDFYLTTDAERKGSQNIGLAMKPFEMAGEGWREIGKATGIPYAEPILGTMGEASAMFGFGGAPKAIKARAGKPFEGMRGVVTEAKGDFAIKPDAPRYVMEDAPQADVPSVQTVTKPSEAVSATPKAELPKTETPTYDMAWEIEDFMQNKNVFQNAIDGRPAHTDSYNTIIDYKNLADVINEIKNNYTLDQWGNIEQYWRGNSYLSPNQAQLANYIKRYILPQTEPNIGTLESMVKGGKTGEPPKYAGDSNLNLERLDTTNDVKHFADGLAKQAGIEKTPQSWEVTEQLAKDLAWDEKEFLKVAKEKGGFDTAETYAMRQINANAVNNVFNTIREMPADPLLRTDAMRLQALDSVNNYIEIAKAYTEKTAEAGRSLNIYRKLMAENPDFVQNKTRETAFKKMFDANGGKKLTDDMINDLQKIDFKDPVAVRNILQKYHKATIPDKLFEAWLNGILSNPTTHMANVIGNSLTMLTKVPETAIAGVLRGKLPLGELKAESLGMVQGIKEGAMAGFKAFQTGMPADMVTKLEHTRYNAISGTKGKIIRIPTRALTAADEFFKAVVYRSEVNRLSYLKAVKETKGGENVSRRMADIINDPTLNADIFNKAREEAQYRTFQKPLGNFGTKVMSLRDSVYPMKYIIPFIKTPTNIMKFTLERTPANFAKIMWDFKKGKITAEQLPSELSKPVLGSLISAAAVLYVLDGTITGGAPKNKKERELKYASGWQPYSIKIGDTYYSYSRLEPIGSILGLTADFVNTVNHSDEKTSNEIASELVLAVTKNLSSKTFLSGLSKFMDALSDPEHYGATYVEQLAGSLVPSGVAAVARSIDPNMREVESPLDSMKARIPMMSKSLPYREGAYGIPVENQGGFLNMISPVRVSKETEYKELADRDLELLKEHRLLEKDKRRTKKALDRERRIQ
jgi:hypothetical protein